MIDILYESSYYGVSSLGSGQLYHHGIKGQKWGVRRFQYEDGILTPAGRARYDVGPAELKSKRKIAKRLNAADNMISDAEYVKRRAANKIEKYEKKRSKYEGKDSKRAQRKTEKLNKKIEAQKSTQKSAEKTQKEVRKIRDQVIKKAVAAGMDVKSTPQYKDAQSVRKMLRTMSYGKYGHDVAMITSLADRTSVVRGESYKVSKSKTGKGTYTKVKQPAGKHDETKYIVKEQIKRNIKDSILTTTLHAAGNVALAMLAPDEYRKIRASEGGSRRRRHHD